VKSVRLGPALEEKVQRAARALGISQSAFIRDALARRCEEVLGGALAPRLAPVIGVVESSGGRAGRTRAALRAVLDRKRRR
jgi:hypothetical protein